MDTIKDSWSIDCEPWPDPLTEPWPILEPISWKVEIEPWPDPLTDKWDTELPPWPPLEPINWEIELLPWPDPLTELLDRLDTIKKGDPHQVNFTRITRLQKRLLSPCTRLNLK